MSLQTGQLLQNFATEGPVGAVESAISGAIGISFKAPSAARARNVVGRVLQSALAGNLTAVRCLSERRYIGLQSERQVWAQAFDQLQQQRPDLVALFEANKTAVPAVDHTNPESAANSALAHPYSIGQAAPAASSVGGGAGAGLAGENFVQQLLDYFGLGPKGQQQLAATAGQNAGQQVSQGIVRAALIVAAVVVVIVLLRRRL